MKWLLLVTCLGCEPPRDEPIILPGHVFTSKQICERLGGALITDFERTYAAAMRQRNIKLAYKCIEAIGLPAGRGGLEARR
jgi:hypothetical protein